MAMCGIGFQAFFSVMSEFLSRFKFWTYFGECESNGMKRRVEDLLPGLPDALTLDLVVPLLPWRAFYSLSAVSRSWRQAIRNREVYDARVCSHSTETLFAFVHYASRQRNYSAISLYSVKDNSWHRLPPLPRCPTGLPIDCRCIALDGKLYIIGGWELNRRNHGIREVYVLDLAEQRGWKKCARMREAREDFQIGLVGGKICAFGRWDCGKGDYTCKSEMFDANENVWSSIRPMNVKAGSRWFNVLTVGEELLVYGTTRAKSFSNALSFSELYHPGRDEWRLVKPFGCANAEQFFMAEGELHAISLMGIHVVDIETGANSCIGRHFSLSPENEHPAYEIRVLEIHVVDGELLALLDCHQYYRQCRVLKSRGFRSRKADIVWEDVDCPLELSIVACMSPIEL